MSNLLQFANNLIEESDGVVEWEAGEKTCKALLPGEVQRRLGLSESLVSLTDNTRTGGNGEDDASDMVPIGYGTEFLERAIPMALEMGKTAALRMPYLVSRKKSDKDAGDYFSFPNSAFKEKGSHESTLDYWLWSFEVAADADERHEAVHHTCVSTDGVDCPLLPELILGQASHWEPLTVKPMEFSQKRLNALFITACDRTLWRVRESLSGFKDKVLRHHVRDIQRIETYFEDLKGEMADEIKRRNLKGADLEIRREKIQALSGEKSAKLAALEDKYRVRLTIRPLTLLLARLPVRRHDLLIKRRKGERRISVVYNLLSREFDPMACEACGMDTYSLGFCDDALHLLCPSCLAVFANRKKCPRCSGKRPPGGMSDVLRHQGIKAYGEKEK